eukprot:525608_1
MQLLKNEIAERIVIKLTESTKQFNDFINRIILSTSKLSIFSQTSIVLIICVLIMVSPEYVNVLVIIVLVVMVLFTLILYDDTKQPLQTQNQLMNLSNPPFDQNHQISHILTLNKIEFLITVDNKHKLLKEIWIYNICNDKYTKLIHEKSVNENIRYYT